MGHAVVTLSLSRRADRVPDRTAVVDISEDYRYAPAETVHENRVSYAELSEITAETGARLESIGIDAGDTVCLLTRNRIASLALLFACRRLGATFAPISHLLTPVTVEYPFDVLEPTLLIAETAQRDLVHSAPIADDQVLTLSELADIDVSDTDANRQSQLDTPRPRVGDDQDAETEHPLLLLHGEGGHPVVAYSAQALEWNCIAAMTTWGLSKGDTVPLITPLSAYDGLLRVALPTVYAGGTLLLDRAFDPGDMLTAIEREEATLLSGRTATLRGLASKSDFPDALESLSFVAPDVSVPRSALEPYREAGISLARVYGRLECPFACAQEPAEQTNAVTAAGTDDERRYVGHPVLDCRVRVRGADDGDGAGSRIEGATEGRLALSGPVLADGYAGTANEPAVDQDRLDERTDDHETNTADRAQFANGWLETTDLCRRDNDGQFTIAQ
ncbi:AMP-binding protein [Natronolimnobius sp. AArcel1]|uniref:AMP-binding protein n=1 Tax=Natronolimnobius sp. AArcel1 TaxID=1679093 RepID=UPI0031B73975